MDDLEVNPLYGAFLTRFRREFELACRASHVIAIPKSETLENRLIDVHFANSHILVPSKLLKMHYHPSQVGDFEDIEMESTKLVCTSRKPGGACERQIVRIVAEEMGYNALGKEYRLLLISKPLALARRPDSRGLSLRGILSSRSLAPATSKLRAHLINSRLLLGHDDCARYLEFISRQLTMDLESDVRRFQSNYVILSHYLEDAAQRTRQMAESYVAKYELALGLACPDGPLEVCDTIRRSIRLALENYVVHLMHARLLVAVQSKHRAKDEMLAAKFESVLASRLSICDLGAQGDFSDFNLDDKLAKLLRQLPSRESPLAMVSCLLRLADLIGDALNQSVRFKRILGITPIHREPGKLPPPGPNLFSHTPGLGDAVPVCSDDLIASFVYCLPRAEPSHLFSALEYLKLFGWTAAEKDVTAYHLATLELAIEYILQFESP